MPGYHDELSNSRIIFKSHNDSSDHATNVTRIAAGSNGVAPGTTVYNDGTTYQNIENLITQGAVVINASWGDTERSSVYTDREKWIDHISPYHGVSFVKSAGNNGSFITCPGMAYNAITVGAYTSNGTDNIYDDEMRPFSSFDNVINNITGCEKPDMIAGNDFITTVATSNTSYSAPVITGIIALMIEFEPSLATEPEAIKAILMASSHRKVISNPEEFMSQGITNKQGAGAPNAYEAICIIARGQYGIRELAYDTEDEFSIDVPSFGDNVNFGIAWRQDNYMGSEHSSNNLNDVYMGYIHNINLFIYREPSLLLTGSSTLENSSTEMVYFSKLPLDENYNIHVTKNYFGYPVRYAYAWNAYDDYDIYNGGNPLKYTITSPTTVQVGSSYNGVHTSTPAILPSYTKHVTVPASVQIGTRWYDITSIAPYAFKGCNFSSIDFCDNDKLASIGDYAFENCTNLTQIIFPDNLVSIGSRAFHGCMSLEEVTVPHNVSYVAPDAFAGRNGIMEILCPGNNYGYYSLGGLLYYKRTSSSHDLIGYPSGRLAKNVFINANVTSKHSNEMMQNVIISDSVQSIVAGAFNACVDATLYVYRNSAGHQYAMSSSNTRPYVVIADNMIYDGALAYKTISANTVQVNNIISPSAINGNIVIPQTVTRNGVTYTVTAVGPNAFRDCANLGSVTLPSTITYIGIAAFHSSDLTAINIPAAVTVIDNHAFNNCRSLVSVNIPADSALTTIGNNVFYHCSSLTAAHLPDTVVTFGDNMFTHCTSLQSVTLPEGITAITAQMFYNNKVLQTLNHAPLTYVGDGAFFGCAQLSSVNLSSDLTYIGTSAFRDSGLTSIHIPAGVTAISNNAFDNCKSLATVSFASDSTLTNIGMYAFVHCTNLMAIDIPDGVSNLGSYAFAHCTSLASVDLPDALTAIQYHTFYSCTVLEEIYIPADVTSVGDFAFTHCVSLTNVYMPETLTTIGNNAFLGCGSYVIIYYSA